MKLKFERMEFNRLKKKIIKNEFDKVVFNFLNSNDLYSLKRIKEFRTRLLNKKKFIDGSIISFILSLKNFKKVFRMGGPRFIRLFLENKELNKNKKHFFIGIDEKKLKKIKEKIVLKSMQIQRYDPPYIKGIKLLKKEIEKIIKKIKKSKSDYIWIEIRSPKQNLLSQEICKGLNKKVFIFKGGVGIGLTLKNKKEAQKYIQELGNEWLYLLVADFKHAWKKVWKSLLESIWGFNIIELENGK